MKLVNNSLVLVVVLPERKDLEIARLLGWYRIPLRRAPKVIHIDFLAFYQPGSFGNRGGRIEWIAPVLGHELTTRRELLHDQYDHPRAREEYFKIQIGPLQPLQRPVRAAGWKRLTFLYTTGERLRQGQVLNDLVLGPEDRNLLWQGLRERRKQYLEAPEIGPGSWPEIPDLQALVDLILGFSPPSQP